MHIKILVAATLVVGMTTGGSEAASDAPETPAVVTANANGTNKGSLAPLLKQFIRGGKAAPTAEREEKVARLEEFASGTSRNAKRVNEAKSPKARQSYHTIISRYAAEYGVPVALAHAVISVESNYRASARGRAGEIGLMQIKPSTARGLGYRGSAGALFDPETNIKYGMKYLAGAYRLGGGNTCGAILRYNAGHGAKRMNPVSSAYCTKVKRILAGG
ncbi:lytic transglycosylase domain-containing protein [Chelativorans salis]|uniref:Lytic transglycosylase domain-containing protein n=1 Tax=Chelativorans salis TaxID=2978478 RepID=A0ABT2LL41_9HYPH|nr:lytic transglycosylase domain-containing protein [Chelativorans sp. EGI FJ00035]MCT7375001.1 lytic transglycosylase domain-containing protein [Chelativorans sp. EGI FJ00035]